MTEVSRAHESHNVGPASSVLNSLGMNFKGKGENLDSNLLAPSQPYSFGFRHFVAKEEMS